MRARWQARAYAHGYDAVGTMAGACVCTCPCTTYMYTYNMYVCGAFDIMAGKMTAGTTTADGGRGQGVGASGYGAFGAMAGKTMAGMRRWGADGGRGQEVGASGAGIRRQGPGGSDAEQRGSKSAHQGADPREVQGTGLVCSAGRGDRAAVIESFVSSSAELVDLTRGDRAAVASAADPAEQ